MKRQPRILAGTALGLLMASAPLGAVPLLKGAGTELSPRAANAVASEFAPVFSRNRNARRARRKNNALSA